MIRIFYKSRYDFLRFWRVAAALTVAFILLGLASFGFTGGVNYSIEFTGGTLMQLTFKQPPDVATLRTELIAIRSIYDQLNVVRKPHEGPSPSGRMVLGDDVSVSITADKFDQLKQAVVALRTRITRPEDSTSNP